MRRLIRDERGVSAVIVALLVTALFGFAAIAIDVAEVVAEKRQLQNGADAAALAVAKDCATKATCGSAAATANTFADANADDSQSNVDEVCGSGPGLPGCSAPPVLPAGATGYVRVRTSTNETDNAGNPSEVDHHFAPVLSDAFVGETVNGSAVAAWGAPAVGAVLPLTISICSFDQITANGTTFATPTGGTPPYSGTQQVVKFHKDPGTTMCPKGPAGKLVPGGWGSLDPGANCAVTVSAGGTYAGDPGNDPPDSPCTPAMFLNKTVLVPIFDDVTGTGSGTQFHLKGFAAFHVTGMRLGGGGSSWTVNPPAGCAPSERCIGGWFVKFVAPGDAFGGPSLGAVIVKMIG